MDIEICMERRPCYVNDKRAMFHRWVEKIEAQKFIQIFTSDPPSAVVQLKDTFALVEFENGKVELVRPENIQFADGGDFDAINFLPLNIDSTEKEEKKCRKK